MERETGFEPATATLATWGSTTELLPHQRLPGLSIPPLRSVKHFRPIEYGLGLV